MTKEKARQLLLDGEHLLYHAWIFSQYYMTCGDEMGCCENDFDGVEDALNNIEFFCGKDWEKVTLA